MTDLNKLRSEFEALPQIKGVLIGGEFYFSTLSMNYKPKNSQNENYLHCTYFLNGGWYAFQEKAKAQAVPEWISVDDKWPEYGQSILVVINGLTQTRVFYRDGSDCSEDWIEPVNDEDRNNIWWNKVTYWMPLPTAPSESGAEG